MSHHLQQLTTLRGVVPDEPDDALLLAASFEPRCRGVARALTGYRCKRVLMTVYEPPSARCEDNAAWLGARLPAAGQVVRVPARRDDPAANVAATIELILGCVSGRRPRLTMDVTCFTKRHLLELLHGLDEAGLLQLTQFLHSEPLDFPVHDEEPISEGVRSVQPLEKFGSLAAPAGATVLALFLGYEGRRAMAVWDELEPEITFAVIPDPPYRPEWAQRTEAQNRELLALLPPDQVLRSHSLHPADTERLLKELLDGGRFPPDRFRCVIAPAGTKAQTLGVYRFWRRHRGRCAIVYAAARAYKADQTLFPPGRTWIIDRSDTWD
jgi:hypothetical protein